MRRRDFITALGGVRVAWPLAARAQQGHMRRLGILMGWDESPEAKRLLSKFTLRLQELGWTEGRDMRLDVRWAAGNVDRMRAFAKERSGWNPT